MFGKEASIYCVKTVFYGLCVMPMEFQRITHTILIKRQNVFVFPAPVIITTKGNKQLHSNKLRERSESLDENGFKLKGEKILLKVIFSGLNTNCQRKR